MRGIITSSDTIAAIATPPGIGAIAVIRVSGPNAIAIVNKCFKPSTRLGLPDFPSNSIRHGFIVDREKGVMIDEVMVAVYRKPRSYTGEDMVEIDTHGGYVVPRAVLECVLNAGARLAERGEFTKRAFLNGKMDAIQAEAVMDVISAKTELSLRQGMSQLSGRLSREIESIRERLLDCAAEVEVGLDYPDEYFEDIDDKLLKELDSVKMRLKRLLSTATEGMLLRSGINTVILGKPNVGKSSLMNRILGTDRSIVTQTPGTTRDFITETINMRGIPLNIVDTAGIREVEDEAEREGVNRALKMAETADMILFVLDASEPVQDIDLEILDKIRNKRYIIVINKIDVNSKLDVELIREHLGTDKHIVTISALKGEGLEKLEDFIYDEITSKDTNIGFTPMITNIRQKQLISKMFNAVKDATNLLKTGSFLDLVATDLRDAIEASDEMLGRIYTDDLLDKMFSNFCVGK